ncbi:MAG: hypothetical protein WKG07_26990 [Hymenobacter sp.]
MTVVDEPGRVVAQLSAGPDGRVQAAGPYPTRRPLRGAWGRWPAAGPAATRRQLGPT